MTISPRVIYNRPTIKRKTSNRSRRGLRYMTELVEDFGRYLVREGRYPATVRKYLKDNRQFFKEKGILSVSDINRDTINDWVLTLRERGCTTGTIANHLWAIKAFLVFLKRDKDICLYEFNIRIPAVKPPDTVEYLAIDELKRLRSLIDVNTIHGLRLRTFIEVMINTGLRPTETLNLRKEDLILQPDEIAIIGKGGKPRKIYFSDHTYFWVRKYLAARNDSHPAIFVTHGSYGETKVLRLRLIEHAFQQLMKRANMNKRIVLHTLRHTYATNLMMNGCPPDYVARLLGHSKVETTRRHYLAVVQTHAKAAHFRFLNFEQENNDGLFQRSPVPQLTDPGLTRHVGASEKTQKA